MVVRMHNYFTKECNSMVVYEAEERLHFGEKELFLTETNIGSDHADCFFFNFFNTAKMFIFNPTDEFCDYISYMDRTDAIIDLERYKFSRVDELSEIKLGSKEMQMLYLSEKVAYFNQDGWLSDLMKLMTDPITSLTAEEEYEVYDEEPFY